jgi:hypothetical protein
MSYTPRDPLVASTKSGELPEALARWEYEGGAGATGPQEGYRVVSKAIST